MVRSGAVIVTLGPGWAACGRSDWGRLRAPGLA